ncbi:SDR family NAD(P)-dependent oxidoreductase [Aeromicrobium sp. CTD01-1L150]|uniref:SDR family NAD(P)-dependent oxidoreductase n=1 Tax=Aeromicrobium sp. CTD01-1L150 TaxID=3341830 RepID=UPI0035BFFF31
MSVDQEQPVALVTGGSRGIGLAIATALGRAGYAIVIGDVLADEGASAVQDLTDTGLTASFVDLDVRSCESVGSAIAGLSAEHGRLDLAVNNAGVRGVGEVAEFSEEDWVRVVDVNLTGVFRCMSQQIPMLIETGGSIVNMASMWGLAGWPGRSAYVASKHGVVGLTRSAAREYGSRGVRVNAVAPGPIETEAALGTVGGPSQELSAITSRIALERLGQPDDIAGAVLWLASAAYVTGEVVSVDGGWGA